jgi:hypothetical protein
MKLRIDRSGNGTVVQLWNDNMLMDTWAAHIDPLPSREVASAMADRIVELTEALVAIVGDDPYEERIGEDLVHRYVECSWCFSEKGSPHKARCLWQKSRVLIGED